MSTDLNSLLERAEAHLSTKETTKARPLLERAVAQGAESARLYNNLGLLEAYDGQSQAAFTHFSRALALEPTDTRSAVNLANLLVLTDRVDAAKGILNRVAEVLRVSGETERADELAAYAEQVALPPEPEHVLSRMHEYEAAGIDQVGYDLIDGEWFPWIQVDGMTLYNLPLTHLSELKPEADLGVLLRVGWNQSVGDMKFRFDCSSRYVPPHLNHPITPGQTIVELGAYLGHFSMFLAQSTGPTGRVLAVEFIPENYTVLKQNLAKNFPEIGTAVHCGVWSENGTRPAYRHMLQANSFTPHSLTGEYSPVEVPCKTVDTLLEEQGIDEVDLMVVTINGTELEAFKGMTQSLPKIKAFAIAARYGEGDENRTETVYNWLMDNGYTPTIVGGDHVYATRNSPG
jgi:FkbM family methyltransferase